MAAQAHSHHAQHAGDLAMFDRYHRQMLLPFIGEEGQRRLATAHALIVGCGALGSIIIDHLARAGVGSLTIVDRDVIELTNLQRQVLYDERDVAECLPKAEAARRRIAQVNSQVRVHAVIDDFTAGNAEAIAFHGCHQSPVLSATGAIRHGRHPDIILDGLDNFETRYLLNDLAVKHGIPFIYGGAVSTSGVSLAVTPMDGPHRTPCLRCVFPEAPPPGASPTCDTAGVLASAVTWIAAHQATQAIKLLTGHLDAVDRSLLSIDVWSNEVRRFDVSNARSAECPCCGRRQFEYLEGERGGGTVSLCGRNAVQITTAPGNAAQRIDLAALARTLAPHGMFTNNTLLLRGTLRAEHGESDEAIELTVFPNGRAIIKGTHDPARARSLYAKYIGA